MDFPPTIIAKAYCAGQYKCQYRDNLIGRSFFSEDGTVIVTGKETKNETTRTISASNNSGLHWEMLFLLAKKCWSWGKRCGGYS